MALRITELTQIIEYLAVQTRFIYRFASQYYQNVIRKEINLANITNRDHILCIGGGVCPFSAILLHQTTGAKVTVIDNCKFCTQKSRQVIDRLGLGEYVYAICKDGSSTDLSLKEYSVVHFAMQVFPMEHVFTQVEKRVAPGTKLLIRRPKEHLNKMYDRLSNSLVSCCRRTTHKKTRNIGSTLLYIKQGGGVAT